MNFQFEEHRNEGLALGRGSPALRSLQEPLEATRGCSRPAAGRLPAGPAEGLCPHPGTRRCARRRCWQQAAPSVAESSWRKAGPSQHSRCAARSHLAPRTTKPRWLLWLLQSPQHQPSLRCFNRRFISFHLIPYLPDAGHCISKVTNGNFQSWFFPTTMFSKTTFSGFVLKITPTLQNRKAQKAIRVWVC